MKLIVAAIVIVGLTATAFAQPLRRSSVPLTAPEKRGKAAEFPESFQWLNIDGPLQIHGNLKGHVILLDFWTYCCINCMHVLPDLEYLEHKYEGQPVAVIGVHSAKFATERDSRNIAQAIQRYRIAHPVIVDEGHTIWNSYGVRAWPTFVVIDSAGRYVGQQSGEGNRELMDTVIRQLLDEGRSQGTLSKTPIRLKPTLLDRPTTALAFPGKVAADPAGKRLIIADSNHDRLVVADPGGKVLHVIGSGERGFKDGPLREAQFYDPQGIAVDGEVLYVADTKNHSLRKVDLAAGTVTTIAGTGKQEARDRAGGLKGTEQGLSSPWDVVLDRERGRLIIAMAGPHQLWEHDLASGITKAWVGSGRENILDGPADQAALAQPSGLAIHGGYVYFADSEVSAIRRASLADGRVETLIGTGLFDFGHRDGDWSTAQLQHCLGVAALGDDLFVADTYNNALRRIRLKERTIETVLGGPDSDALDEPAGLTVLDGKIYIADTNNHRIVRYDPATSKAETVQVKIE